MHYSLWMLANSECFNKKTILFSWLKFKFVVLINLTALIFILRHFQKGCIYGCKIASHMNFGVWTKSCACSIYTGVSTCNLHQNCAAPMLWNNFNKYVCLPICFTHYLSVYNTLVSLFPAVTRGFVYLDIFLLFSITMSNQFYDSALNSRITLMHSHFLMCFLQKTWVR